MALPDVGFLHVCRVYEAYFGLTPSDPPGADPERINHKYSYFVDKFGSDRLRRLRAVLRLCPVNIDLIDILRQEGGAMKNHDNPYIPYTATVEGPGMNTASAASRLSKVVLDDPAIRGAEPPPGQCAMIGVLGVGASMISSLLAYGKGYYVFSMKAEGYLGAASSGG